MRWHGEQSLSDGEDSTGDIAADQQQRWLRGASLRASRNKKHSSLAPPDSSGLQSTDDDLSGSVGWGVGLDVEADAEDGVLDKAEARLEAKLEAKRNRHSKSAEGGRSRSNSASKSSSKRSKRSKEGDERKQDKKRDSSGKLSRNYSPSAVAAARSAPRDSAEFLATPGRPKKERSSNRSSKTATVADLDTSIPVDSERKEPLGNKKTLPKEYATLVSAWAAGGMEMQWRTSSGTGGNGDGSQGSLAIGLSELRALVSAAFDAVTGTEGWETRSDEALMVVDSKHRTELLTSTICLVERAVRSKSITTAAKQGTAAAVLEERMLPVGFPRDFVGQLALCLEKCFEDRRMQRKGRKATGKASQRPKLLPEPSRLAPPPPPLEQPAAPGTPAPALPTGLVAAAPREERSQGQDAGIGGSVVPVVQYHKYGGVALPGFEQMGSAARPGPTASGSAADPQSAATPVAAESIPAPIESVGGYLTRHSDAETARVLREQVRAYACAIALCVPEHSC